MAWYEAHQTLAKHPKTLKFASLINCERRYAVGLLHDLFTWGLDMAKSDGSLPGLGPKEIASALDFAGKKGARIVTALVESGYIECENGVYKIHDWYDYAGKLADRREADKRRKHGKNSAGNPQEIQRNNSGNPYATVPYRTVQYPIDNNKAATGITRARESEPEPDADLSRVMTFFMDKVNATPSRYCVDMIKAYTESLGADVVLHAFGIALDERKAGWRYIQGILQRYEREGLTNMDAVLQAEADFDARREAKKANSETANTFLAMYEEEHSR